MLEWRTVHKDEYRLLLDNSIYVLYLRPSDDLVERNMWVVSSFATQTKVTGSDLEEVKGKALQVFYEGLAKLHELVGRKISVSVR